MVPTHRFNVAPFADFGAMDPSVLMDLNSRAHTRMQYPEVAYSVSRWWGDVWASTRCAAVDRMTP